MSAAPHITISSLGRDGVVLLPSSHPEFESAFKAGRAKEYDPILPYTVVIKNNTDEEIIAYSVLWNCTDADGHFTRSRRTVVNFSNLAPGANLIPHATEIVSMLSGLEAGGQRADFATVSRIDKDAARFSQQRDVNIALDAVLFADGSAIGPDAAHSIPRWKAWLDAEKEVLMAATRMSPSELQPGLRRLAEPGVEIVRRSNGDLRNFADLSIMADHSDNYAECLILARGFFALAILDELEHGHMPTMENIRGILRSKRYPIVHRKNAEPGNGVKE